MPGFFKSGFQFADRMAGYALMGPVFVYRYTLSALVGRHCRHEPSCSAYALEALRVNGGWRGFWLTAARVWRCGPGGSHGYDPVPDIRANNKPLWRAYEYGVWSKRQVMAQQMPDGNEGVE